MTSSPSRRPGKPSQGKKSSASPARLGFAQDDPTHPMRRASIVVGDAGNPAAWHDGEGFDRILAD
ncbi:hypothetical protein, partial [Paraburkholderia sp. BR10882]|uniref:hypothetical protein n=1 Tax=Paraburkholderia sp. BR10882 TaxID=3236991 RepID=UPI0034CD99AD